MNGDPSISQPWLAEKLAGARRALRARTSRRILKNIAALSIAQAAAYLLPLVVIPYTASVLGPAGFGMIAMIQAVVQYSTLITNYGFSFSATRQAAVCQGAPEKLAEIVVNVWTAKLALMAFCLSVSLGAFAVTPSLRPLMGPYLCGFLTVAGGVLYLDWFFQAIEEMKWITIINVIPKVLLTPLIFVFVKRPSDWMLVILIQSGTFLVSGLAGAALVRGRLRVPLPAPTWNGVRSQVQDGWRTFLTTVSINVYTTTNTVILGLMTNTTVVGYYSAGQRVISGVQALWPPVSQSLYPHFCKSFNTDPIRAAGQLKRLVGIVLAVTLLGAIGVCFAAPYFVPLYLGPRFAHSVRIIQFLIFSVCAIATSNLLGIHGLMASGFYSDVLAVVFGAAVSSLALAPLCIAWKGAMGLAALSTAIEIGICVCFALRMRRRSML